MISKKAWDTIGLVYDQVHLALWASLISFVLYFVIVVMPTLPAAQAEFQRERIQQISAEYEFYCNKWGMSAHSPTHDKCILDLQAFRTQIAARANAESELW